ncbi:MAG: tetratricopeptide repeat protein, partial [Halobacteriaceae archaeon]
DLDPPELEVDASEVDPVDSRVLADLLDERQVARDEVDADRLVDVGLEYMGINRHEQAADAFERAAQFADDDGVRQEAWVNKGVAHAELEEYDRAIGAYREALSVEGEHTAAAHANLAYALWEFGEDEEAFQHAEEAVREDERLPQAWYNLGFVQVERGQYEDAVDCLDKALRLGMRSAPVYEEKARALEGLGREQEAEEAAERAAEIREQREDDLVG